MPKLPLKPEMKLGADRKRVMMLGGLLALLAIVWWLNRSDTPAATASTPPRPSPSAAVPAPVQRPKTPGTRPRFPNATQPGTAARSAQFGAGRGQSSQEWKPSLAAPDALPIDPAQVDPTLRLDVIAKLQVVKPEGGARSVFDFGQAAAPKVEIAQVKPVIPKPIKGIMTGPQQPPKPAPPPPPPPPPPIPLKFYGFAANRPGIKRAFFLEGEDIYVAGEGETIKNRYKVIRIGVNSAVVEDTSNKNQQTLPLVQEFQEAS